MEGYLKQMTMKNVARGKSAEGLMACSFRSATQRRLGKALGERDKILRMRVKAAH